MVEDAAVTQCHLDYVMQLFRDFYYYFFSFFFLFYFEKKKKYTYVRYPFQVLFCRLLRLTPYVLSGTKGKFEPLAGGTRPSSPVDRVGARWAAGPLGRWAAELETAMTTCNRQATTAAAAAAAAPAVDRYTAATSRCRMPHTQPASQLPGVTAEAATPRRPLSQHTNLTGYRLVTCLTWPGLSHATLTAPPSAAAWPVPPHRRATARSRGALFQHPASST